MTKSPQLKSSQPNFIELMQLEYVEDVNEKIIAEFSIYRFIYSFIT